MKPLHDHAFLSRLSARPELYRMLVIILVFHLSSLLLHLLIVPAGFSHWMFAIQSYWRILLSVTYMISIGSLLLPLVYYRASVSAQWLLVIFTIALGLSSFGILPRYGIVNSTHTLLLAAFSALTSAILFVRMKTDDIRGYYNGIGWVFFIVFAVGVVEPDLGDITFEQWSITLHTVFNFLLLGVILLLMLRMSKLIRKREVAETAETMFDDETN